MSDIREMTDVRELDPVEMAGVEGGFLIVPDGYCGTPVPWPPLPRTLPPSPVVDTSKIMAILIG
jgi:hypothetical protein